MARTTIGLINGTSTLTNDRVARVAAAIERQLRRDLKPIWDVEADMVAYGAHDTIPVGVWPLILFDDKPNLPAGAHFLEQGSPFAQVTTKRDWVLATSHECIEMLVDPSGEATRPSRGLALAASGVVDTDEEFHYIVEACDPIEDVAHCYEIDGFRVSDFYTPHYFDAAARAGTHYSFNGSLTRPREVGPNGYLSWRDPSTGKLKQLRNFGAFAIVDIPDGKAAEETTRTFIDRSTPTPRTHPELFRR